MHVLTTALLPPRCEVFLRDDGAPALSLAHYNGIYQGQEKMKIVRGCCACCLCCAPLCCALCLPAAAAAVLQCGPSVQRAPPLPTPQAPHRVNVSKLTPPDLSGGYLLGCEWAGGGAAPRAWLARDGGAAPPWPSRPPPSPTCTH